MPTYEYECNKCNEHFEMFQNMTEKPIRTCPKCGGDVKRLIGKGSGIIFKGSGFYATDYRKKSPSKEPACPESGKSKACESCPAKKENK